MSKASNYPPGVTGNEPEISGGDPESEPEISDRAADALADFILADAELRGDESGDQSDDTSDGSGIEDEPETLTAEDPRVPPGMLNPDGTLHILPFDPMNTLRGAGPAQLTAETDLAPTGQKFMWLCIRTPSTTVAIPLSRDDAMKWGAEIKRVAGQISPLVVAPAGSVPLLRPGRKS